MTLESKSPDNTNASVPVKRKVFRGMPELHTPDARIVKIFNGWMKKHKESGREYSEFEWNEQNLEFENFILTRNESSNRDLYENHLDDMVESRLKGEDFRNINDAICFNTDGYLETGQHRAVAGIRAGVGSKHIVKIVPVGSANQADLSKPINSKDKWKREGIRKDNVIIRGAIIRLLLTIEHNSLRPNFRTDQKVHLYSQALNGNELFENAVRYPTKNKKRPFSSYAALGTAYYIIARSQKGEDFMDELFNGTKRTRHKRNINGLRKYLARLDANSKSGDRDFKAGDELNLRAINAIVLSWNSYPNEPESYIHFDEDRLVAEARK